MHQLYKLAKILYLPSKAILWRSNHNISLDGECDRSMDNSGSTLVCRLSYQFPVRPATDICTLSSLQQALVIHAWSSASLTAPPLTRTTKLWYGNQIIGLQPICRSAIYMSTAHDGLHLLHNSFGLSHIYY